MPQYDYDLIAVGAGAGGFVSAKVAAGVGKKVAMVEKKKLGGECTNAGCVPSKALLKAAAVAHQVRHLRGLRPRSLRENFSFRERTRCSTRARR